MSQKLSDANISQLKDRFGLFYAQFVRVIKIREIL